MRLDDRRGDVQFFAYQLERDTTIFGQRRSLANPKHSRSRSPPSDSQNCHLLAHQ